MAVDNTQVLALLSECEKEPIHIPGAIQPFGVLLTVDPAGFVIRNASENCMQYFGWSAREMVGKSFIELVDKDDLQRLSLYLSPVEIENSSPLVIGLVSSYDKGMRPWELTAHRFLGSVYLELEPCISSVAPANFQHAVRAAVYALQSAESLQSLCDRTTQQVKAITGFDRVMVYRFDEDWHGVVFAEACSPGVDSYLGHHFPASDIPPQARAIFLQNWLRMIPDVDYVPSPIYPDLNPQATGPLDLGKTLLRSVSPIHLEYLRNMGVKASLTVSLIDEGRLWGLIACHHGSPLHVHSDARSVAELIGQLVSSQIRIKERLEGQRHKQRLDEAVARILHQLGCEPELGQALARYLTDIHGLASSAPGSVAVCYGGHWTTIGKTPAVDELDQIVDWLGQAFPGQDVYHTSRLGREFPAAEVYAELASGLLALSIARSHRDFILWFRPEVSATVTWAGPPQKAVRQSDGVQRLHPRESFASWKETVQGTSLPWNNVEIDAVESLRNGIVRIALQQEYQKEQAARRKAERLSKEKDEMVMIVSHDLKAPLNVASLSFEFLEQFHPSTDPAVQRMVVRGKRATETMQMLITSILDATMLEARTLQLVLKPENAAELIREVVEAAMAVADEKGVRLSAQDSAAGNLLSVHCERYRIIQVLNNLVQNALKFTERGGEVRLAAHADGSRVRFSVADTGMGIHQDSLEKIFLRYWQAEDGEQRRGTGLGLWIAKGIVEMHGGTIWAESRPGLGSTFYFTLPAAADAGGTPEKGGAT